MSIADLCKESLLKIAENNQECIDNLINLLSISSHQKVWECVSEILKIIAINNEPAIKGLNDIVNKRENPELEIFIMIILARINPVNVECYKDLIQSDRLSSAQIKEVLEYIDKGGIELYNLLYKRLDSQVLENNNMDEEKNIYDF